MTKRISAAMLAHLAGSVTTLAHCWMVTRKDGTVLRVTNHDRDVLIAGWVAPDDGLNGTYLCASGFAAKDLAQSDSLAVDNTEIEGILSSPAITESSLLAGDWDAADIVKFRVNWADLTMGPIYDRVGTIGEVTTGRSKFRSEQRGITQAYSQQFGRTYTAGCLWSLGDSRCTVAVTPVTGTLTDVNPDGLTLYDPTRVEAGPGTGIAITGITNANPCVVTLASTCPFIDGQAIVLSGIVGPALLNVTTVAHNPSGNTFELDIDTSDTAAYPPYVSGGEAVALGADSGYFDFGVCTMTSGVNIGRAMEVKSYVPGQWTLQLPFPELCSVGDTYSMTRGCNRAYVTCRDVFNNLVNYGGFPFLPGLDKLTQVARHGG